MASLNRFLRYFRPWRLQLVPVVIACGMEMAFNAQIPLSVKFLIDRAISRHNARLMVLILAGLVAGGVLVSAGGLMRDFYYYRVVAGIIAQLRTAMFDRLQRLSLDYYARTEGGDILSRFSNDLATVESGLSMAVSWGVQPALDILISAVLVFLLDWRLALVGLLLSPLVLVGPRLFSARTESLSDSKQEQEGRVVSMVQENIAAAAVIRAYGTQTSALEAFQARNTSLRDTTLRLRILRAFMERSSTLSTLLLQISVIGIAGFMAYRGSVTIGTFVSFQTLFMTLSYSIGYLAQFSPGLSAAAGGLNRVEQLLAEKPKVADAPAALAARPLTHSIEFRDTVFSYSGEMRNLDGVNLSIPCGASVAFVGPSGSGKSTILNLLLRFYDPNEGAAPTTAMTHIAIQERLNGKVVDWLEHVTDEQYRKN